MCACCLYFVCRRSSRNQTPASVVHKKWRRSDSLRGSSVKIGTIQRRLAWPLRKDDAQIEKCKQFVCPTCKKWRRSRPRLQERTRSRSATSFTILYYTILYCTILLYYAIIIYYTILYYTILYYTILYYTILYYTILYYTRLLAFPLRPRSLSGSGILVVSFQNFMFLV